MHTRTSRKLWLMATIWLLSLSAVSAAPESGEPTLFRIGSAGVSGTYFPVATLIASRLSCVSDQIPPAQCGVPGLLAVAQLSNGSVANVRDLQKRSLEAALVQADIAYAAYHGQDTFAKDGPQAHLRAVANLYLESLHLVVKATSPIRTVADLKARRVSMDEPGSGTLESARAVLELYGLQENTFQAIYLKQPLAAQALREGRLDALFLMAGYPAKGITELAKVQDIRLIPITGKAIQALGKTKPFFFVTEIPADIYRGAKRTLTVAVGAQLLVCEWLDEKLVYQITKLLWDENTLARLVRGHPIGRDIRLERALDGVAIPLHPGAARYYKEIDLLGD